VRAKTVTIERDIKEAPMLAVGATFIQDSMKYKLLTIQRVDVDWGRGRVTVVGTGRPLAGYHRRVMKRG